MNFETAIVSTIMDMGEGTRVALDFIDALREDEGILVGDSAKGFFCVLAENRGTETYPPRPFRVNAGALHQYIQMEEGTTKYLSEVQSGDQVLITNGESERLVSVGRVKVEKRPFLKIILENNISATLQKADSVFVAGRCGACHLIELKEGDEVSFVRGEQCARHKGQAIEEFIEEK